MPFNYSAFISYRHPKYKQGRCYTEQIVEALKGELEFKITQEVFRDTERLRGAEFYNEALASALCRSVCMITLYWPTYFSTDHTFCSREYKAMEALEQQRLRLLDDPNERKNGLIIVLAIRDFDSIPKEIRDKRLCYDFESYTLKHGMERNPNFKAEIKKIAEYIAARCRVFEAVPEPPDVCGKCNSFKFPHDSEILPWLTRVVHPGVPFPTRKIGR